MAQAQILYVGTADGLAVLSNPGRSNRWLNAGHELRGQRIKALACDPDQPLEVRAATGSGVLVSRNGGQSWEQAGAELQPAPPPNAIALAGQPLASLRTAGAGIERSEDGGVSWHPAAVPTANPVSTLLAAPYHLDTAFAGTAAGEVLISTDRGRSWQILTSELPPVIALAAGRAL